MLAAQCRPSIVEDRPMISSGIVRITAAVAVAVIGLTGMSRAETIRVAVGTQDTTTNCVTGGLLIREL